VNSCKEDECNFRSEVQVENWTNDPYNFYIDDSFHSTFQKHDTLLIILKPGTYSFKMVQESGFDSIPRIKEESFTADPCTFTWWTITNY
jgi:hypothetical protein